MLPTGGAPHVIFRPRQKKQEIPGLHPTPCFDGTLLESARVLSEAREPWLIS